MSPAKRLSPATYKARALASASPRENEFLELCTRFGYRPLAHRGGWLLTAVKPEHAALFAELPDCVVRSYAPELVGNPERRAAEVEWRRPQAEWPRDGGDDAA